MVKVETSEFDILVDGEDSVTLRCLVDSNPPATIVWRKEGLTDIIGEASEVVFSPVSRHTAGTFVCTAENGLGMSQPAFYDLDVKCKCGNS